jgi:hypothetical protein
MRANKMARKSPASSLSSPTSGFFSLVIRARHLIEYFLFRIASLVFSRLPAKMAYGLGKGLGEAAFVLTFALDRHAESEIALRNSDETIRDLAGRPFFHLASAPVG